jgi:hypothetical protein
MKRALAILLLLLLPVLGLAAPRPFAFTHATVAGHVPIAVSAAEASAAGQKSTEHLYGIHRHWPERPL